MLKSILSIKKALETALQVDKKSVLICIFYNLIKQFMNVFYGVYFIRMILVGLEEKQNIWHVLGVLMLMFVINILFSWFDQYYKNIYLPIFKLKIDSHVNEKIMRKANSIPYDVANSPNELDRYNRVIENSSKKIVSAYQSFGLVCGLIEAFVMILYYVISVDVFAIFLSAFPLLYSYFLAEKSEKFKYELDKKVSSFNRKKEYAKRIYYVHDYTKEIRTFQIGRIVRAIYQDGFEQTVKAYKTDGKRISLVSFFELLLGDAISMVLPIAYVVVRMLCGMQYLIGDFIGITQAITVFSWDVEWMLDIMLELKSASLYISDYVEYISQDELQESQKEKVDVENGFCIKFDHVRYQYPGAPEGVFALDDVSIDIKNGEKIAVVGENGAGKTTFISLLVNLISCCDGKILLNDVDINSYDREDLKSFFGVVCQDYHIYPVSVRENVCVNGAIEKKDVVDALQKVGLAERITDIETVIGKEIDDDGLELSGGERQRLALARVVANEFPVVILDEPTSAMDAITERNINQLILNALQYTNRTLIFISHKLSTTKLVDRILVFENGKIIEEGNHAELMAKNGLYARMYHEQNNMYKGQNS